MRNKIAEKMLALALTGALLGSLAGCGDGNTAAPDTKTADIPKETQDVTESADGQTVKQDAGAEEDGPFGRYPETVTLTRAQMTCAATQWENGDDETNNPWTRAALEEFNIQLEDAWAADGSQYAEKVNLSIASQTLPDVFWVNASQFRQVAELGMVADMTEVYEQYASDTLKGIMDSDREAFESGMVDGKLMGISTQHFGIISQLNYVWIRDDWMQKLNLKAPETMEDVYEICRQFVKNDPDGNGVDDTYGLAMTKELGIMYAMMNSYHAYPNTWLTKEDGSLEYGIVQPEVKDALEAFQGLYAEGILSKEFAVCDSSKMEEDLVSGKVGVVVTGSAFGYGAGINVIKNNGEEAIFKPYVLPSADDGEMKQAIGWPVGNYVVVNKDCKNPEAAIKMINLYTRVVNEGTAEEYNTFVNNERSWGGIPFQVQNPMADYNQYVNISAVQDSRDTSGLAPDQLGKYERVIDWIDNKNPDSVGQYSQVSREGAYSIGKQIVDNGQYVRTAYRGVSTPTMVEKMSSLDAMRDEAFTKIIMGEDISAFDEFVENWNSLGGADITKEMNGLYGN